MKRSAGVTVTRAASWKQRMAPLCVRCPDVFARRLGRTEAVSQPGMCSVKHLDRVLLSLFLSADTRRFLGEAAGSATHCVTCAGGFASASRAFPLCEEQKWECRLPLPGWS